MLSQKRLMTLGPSWIWPLNRRMFWRLLDHLRLAPAFHSIQPGGWFSRTRPGTIRRDLEFSPPWAVPSASRGWFWRASRMRWPAGLGDGYCGCRPPVTHLSEDATGVTVMAKARPSAPVRFILALPPRLGRRLAQTVPGRSDMDGRTDQARWRPIRPPFWRRHGLERGRDLAPWPLARDPRRPSPAYAQAGALLRLCPPRRGTSTGFFTRGAVAQLPRLFSDQMLQPPLTLIFKDWSADHATATPRDRTSPAHHPRYGAIPRTERVIFAGTEAAKRRWPAFLERVALGLLQETACLNL